MVKIKSYSYEPSDTIETQGKSSKIDKYLDKGYKIKEARNGYWVLTKKSNAYATIVDDDGNEKRISIGGIVRDYYDCARLTENKVQKFVKEVNDGTINLQEIL